MPFFPFILCILCFFLKQGDSSQKGFGMYSCGHSCKRTEHKDIAMLKAGAGSVAEELVYKTNHAI